MVKQASNVRKRLRRFLTDDPGRFAGGSAVSDPLGLLAVERERLAVLRSPQHDGSPQTAATANQGTGSTSEPHGSAVLDSTSIAVDVDVDVDVDVTDVTFS
jgi:hypothetical protein